MLEWKESFEGVDNLMGRFDIIISADCLFFMESHQVLINTIQHILASDVSLIIINIRYFVPKYLIL